MGKKVSAIIATINRPDELRKCIESLFNQSYVIEEFVVVDQSNNIKSKNLIDKIFKNLKTRIKYIHDQSIAGLTNARNIGEKNCTGDYCFFIDDDMTIDKDFLLNIIPHLDKDENLKGASGVQTQFESLNYFKLFLFNLFHIGIFSDKRRKIYKFHNRLKNAIYHTNFLSGGLTIYKKEIFKKFKFDENLVKYCLGEDKIFSFQVSRKYKLAIITNAKAHHSRSNIGRYNSAESIESKYIDYHYFYNYGLANKDKNLANICSYHWLKFGLLIEAVSQVLFVRNFNPIKAFLKGVKISRENYNNCIFIAK